MTTAIHNHIDDYLAADLHGELSDTERTDLHTHLVECADCRKLHQETKLMNKVLEDNLANEKADGAFEQRMLAGFRTRAPRRESITNLIGGMLRLRAAQIAIAAVVLLTLVQTGAWLTHEPRYTRTEELAAPLDRLTDESRLQTGALDRGQTFNESQTAPSMAHKPPSARREFAAKIASASRADAALIPAPPPAEQPMPATTSAEPRMKESAMVSGSNIPTAEEQAAKPAETPNPALVNRKLIRNARVELEIISFDDAVQKITAFASEEKGYVATTSSEKQANGKLKGEIVVKVVPENLDRFLQKIRGLGELKNQTLGTEDITKAYFDTDSRLKNARVMESRLVDMLKTKSSDINDLLQVEKELGRVREEIEKMQGELKFWDSQVAFATVTIQLSEKDLEEAAKYLLKERAQLALYTPEVEKVYNDIKALASPKVQISNAQLDRDNTGRVSARVSLVIAPEESDAIIVKTKSLGRVENFEVKTERIAQGGEGMSENATTRRDKVELNITISRDEQEQAVQQTTLRIRTSAVDEKSKALRDLAEKQNGRIRSSTFSRDADGREFANVTLRVPMKNYAALMQSLDSLGKVENVTVQRQNRDDVDLTNAPAELSIQVHSQGNIVSQESGLFATLRRTLAQSAAAIMWSLRMIGVAVAFFAPWIAAIVGLFWIARRIRQARR